MLRKILGVLILVFIFIFIIGALMWAYNWKDVLLALLCTSAISGLVSLSVWLINS